MSESQTIAKLVASLGFVVNDTQLDTFVKKLNATAETLKKFKSDALTGVTFKISVDKTSLSTIKADITALSSKKIRFSDVAIAQKALTALRVQVRDNLDNISLRVKGIKPLASKDLKALQAQVTASLKTTPVVIPAGLNLVKLNQQLKEWTTKLNTSFNYKLKLGVSKSHLMMSLREAVRYAGTQVATIKISNPKVKVGIDRQHLRSEIADALAQIRREVRIKIDLNGSVNGGAGASGNRNTGGMRHAVGGGIAGSLMGAGRGFIPGLSTAFAIAKMSQISQQLQGQRQAMTAVTGSQEAGASTMSRFRGMAGEIGFSWRDVAPSFTKMIASGTSAGMGQGQVEKIFKGLSEYGRVMGLDSEAMKGSFTAIEQMMNKQQIYAEELKTQLGERFPAAIAMMAEAVSVKEGRTVTVPELMELMKKGQVDSSVLIQFAEIAAKRARVGGALDTAKNSPAAMQARFGNSFSSFVERFAANGFDKVMSRFWKEAALGLDFLSGKTTMLADAFEILLTPVFAFVKLLKNSTITQFTASLGLSSKGLAALGVTTLGLIFPWTRLWTVIGWTITALQDFQVFMQGGDSFFGDWFDGLTPEMQEKLEKMGTSLKNLSDTIGEILVMSGEGWSQLFSWFSDSEGGALAATAITKLSDALNGLLRAIIAMKDGDFSAIVPSMKDIVALTPQGQYMSLATGLYDVLGGEAGGWMASHDRRKTGGLNGAIASSNPFANGPMANLSSGTSNVISGPVIFQITSNEPEAIGEFVDRHLQKVFNTSNTNLVERMK